MASKDLKLRKTAGRMPTQGRTKEGIATQRNRYYIRNYNISLSEFEALNALNDSRCWICNKRFQNRQLSVDHWHGFKYIKILTRKVADNTWRAWTEEFNESAVGRTRGSAKKEMSRILLRKSVRGLLCYTCNKFVIGWITDPKIFDGAAAYLRNFDFFKAKNAISRI